MSEIADAVGINKASLYSHYSGKEELFLAIVEDAVYDYGMLFERLLEVSKNMKIQDQLHYHFDEYILYFYRNKEMFYFSNHCLLHAPTELFEKLYPKYLNWEKNYCKKLVDIILAGMRQGIIRKGSPEVKYWSYKTKRDGVLGWLHGSPELKEECLEELWHDFWFGVTERKEDKKE